MAYISNMAQFNEWVQDNGIVSWCVCSSQDKQSNNKQFDYDDERSFEENMDICRRAFERNAGQVLFVTGWRSKTARNNGFSVRVLFADAPAVATPTIAGYGVPDMADMEARIEERIKTRYEKERYERDRRELDEERREFDRQKEDVIGLLVNYLAPAVPALSGLMKGTRIQGVDAEPIRVQRDVEPSGNQKIEPSTEEAGDAAFSDEEAEELYALMERLKKAEPQYLQLLQRVVEMAESGDQMYVMAKGFILK